MYNEEKHLLLDEQIPLLLAYLKEKEKENLFLKSEPILPYYAHLPEEFEIEWTIERFFPAIAINPFYPAYKQREFGVVNVSCQATWAEGRATKGRRLFDYRYIEDINAWFCEQKGFESFPSIYYQKDKQTFFLDY